jgi:hypothetical protein
MQYCEDVAKTIDYVKEQFDHLFIQWLNPGFSDLTDYYDHLGLVDQLLWNRATLTIRDGRGSPTARVQEIREFIYGWASYRNLVFQTQAMEAAS